VYYWLGDPPIPVKGPLTDNTVQVDKIQPLDRTSDKITLMGLKYNFTAVGSFSSFSINASHCMVSTTDVIGACATPSLTEIGEFY